MFVVGGNIDHQFDVGGVIVDQHSLLWCGRCNCWSAQFTVVWSV